MVGYCRKHSRSSPSSGKGPRSRSVEACPVTCSSLDVVPGSRKVAHWWKQVRLGVGEWAWWPSLAEALQYLWLHPWEFLLSQSWLWEQWQMSGPTLVVDQLSLSICCSNMAVATSACWWNSLALASSHSPKVSCLSLWEALLPWQDEQVLVGSSSPLPPDCSPLFCLRQSFKEDKMSLITSVPTQAWTVGVQATS